MVYGLGAATVGLADTAGLVNNKPLSLLLGAGALGCGAFTAWCIYAHRQFSYDGKRKVSKQIVAGIAKYVKFPRGEVGLDVGGGLRQWRIDNRLRQTQSSRQHGGY